MKQCFAPTQQVVELMEIFRQMVNHCIRIGLENEASTLKRLSSLSYSQLAEYEVISYYKLHAISKAAGILANRKQSIKRGRKTKTPYLRKGILVSCYGFKIVDGILKVPILLEHMGPKGMTYFDIPLNMHTQEILSDASVTLRSFILTANGTVSVCYSKEIAEKECTSIKGVDRNLGNLTVGNDRNVIQYNLSEAADIVENTRSIVQSLKRNDVRIRKRIASKYGKRRKNRVQQLLHRVSKRVVAEAREEGTAIVFEKLTHIRRMYQRGNYQGKNYRYRLNSWPFSEMKRQIAYKAQWEGVPIIQLSTSETKGTSQLCPQCGKRLQEDRLHRRESYCQECDRWLDRDVVAAMNIARKGAEVFQRSQGLAGEAMRGNPTTPVILRVNASKLACRMER
ncbi:MAG TPA: transposase [Nitrososphaera sp.]|nr:transposase [Nitrososphaera sp.]